jgi:phage pi2 protein 07
MDYTGKYLDVYEVIYYPNKKMEKYHLRTSMLLPFLQMHIQLIGIL